MLYTIVAVLVLVLDQAVKFWTVKTIAPLATGGDTVSLIPGVLHMTNVQNHGAAFSILANQRWLLVGVSAAFIIAIIVLITTDTIHTKFGRWTAVLVMAGALGNCIDRVMYGYVVDMFEVELFSFAVFNVADIFITVCGILFCIHVIIYREPAEERNAVPRQDRGRVRQLVDDHDDDPDYEEEKSRRRAAKAKAHAAKKEKPDPYANVPKRGVHRSLEDELRPQNPDDPFAEWSEPAPRRPQPDAPAPVRQSAKARQDAWDEPEEEPLDETPARQSAAPKAAAEPAPAKKSAPASPRDELDVGFDEYSLEDILSEFRES